MIHIHHNPGVTAQAMVDALENGEIKTPGSWVHFIRHLERLPPKLRLWTMDRIREIAGDAVHDYVVSWMTGGPRPRPSPTGRRT